MEILIKPVSHIIYFNNIKTMNYYEFKISTLVETKMRNHGLLQNAQELSFLRYFRIKIKSDINIFILIIKYSRGIIKIKDQISIKTQ